MEVIGLLSRLLPFRIEMANKVVRIDKDSWYPVYSILPASDDEGDIFEVDEVALGRWQYARELFEEAQEQMSDYVRVFKDF